MIIRKEESADIDAITEVTIAAFKDHPISKKTEHYIVKALRTADVLVVSLVAEIDGRVVGHIAFSPVSISDGAADWYGLGPVSVLPDFQKQGIGTSLVNEGLSLLKEMGGQVPTRRTGERSVPANAAGPCGAMAMGDGTCSYCLAPASP